MNPERGQLLLPAALVEDLCSGKRPIDDEQRALLASMLEFVDGPFPQLYDRRGMTLANRLWMSPQLRHYVGAPSTAHPPGDIDPALAWIIGDAEPDSPIALDYRTSPPRVLYLGGVNRRSCWIELCNSYEQLMSMLSPDEKAQ